MDVGEIADALAQHRVRVAREALAPLEHHELERLLGAEVLADERLDVVEQLAVVEHGDLHVEDRGFLVAGLAFDALAHLREPLLRALDRVAEARDLRHRPDRRR